MKPSEAKTFSFRAVIIIALLTIIDVGQTFDLKCDEKTEDWYVVGSVKLCSVQGLEITSPNEEITSVNGRTTPSDLDALYIWGQNMNFFPKGIVKFFPKLKALTVFGSKLKSVKQKDLKYLTKLISLNLSYNVIDTLEMNLFKFNQKLKNIELNGNKLKYVDEDLLNGLNDLQTVFFQNNFCIDAKADESNPNVTRQMLVER